jgi:hypothetical protein
MTATDTTSQDTPRDDGRNASTDSLAEAVSPADSTPQGSELALYLHVSLTRGVSRKTQRRFFRRMRGHLASLGLVLAQRAGFCIVLAVRRELVATDRHAVVNWLIDQADTRHIVLSDLLDTARLRAGGYPVTVEDEYAGEPIPDAVLAAVQMLMTHLVDEARMQWAAAMLHPRAALDAD